MFADWVRFFYFYIVDGKRAKSRCVSVCWDGIVCVRFLHSQLIGEMQGAWRWEKLLQIIMIRCSGFFCHSTLRNLIRKSAEYSLAHSAVSSFWIIRERETKVEWRDEACGRWICEHRVPSICWKTNCIMSFTFNFCEMGLILFHTISNNEVFKVELNIGMCLWILIIKWVKTVVNEVYKKRKKLKESTTWQRFQMWYYSWLLSRK
jgi:hypothetical protein